MADATRQPEAGAASNVRDRWDQMFPVLTPAEIERLRRFGHVRTWSRGQALFLTGEPVPGFIVLLSGHVAVTQRDGLGHVTPVVDQGPGQFLAEVGVLSGRASLVDGHAETDVEALVIAPEAVRRLLVAEAGLGERIVRALILRRVGLIQTGAGGAVLVGAPGDADVVRLQNFLTRNGYPHHLLDPAQDPEAAELIARYGEAGGGLPLVVCPHGDVLSNPAEADLSHALGMSAEPDGNKLYDVAVVGAGPAGLATAVYAASEGLSVAVLDCRAYGGQAGASARIENYLGFPTGISGQALAGRAFVQAQKFGAEVMIPVQVTGTRCDEAGQGFTLRLAGEGSVRARTLVIASGARYRRPPIARLAEFEGRGVWYWASPIEGRLCAGEEVILVGGGNSAGQAAVFLSGQASKVRMMIRAEGLAASMSSYLIERINSIDNIELMTRTEITGLEGDGSLQRVSWRDNRSGAETQAPIRHVFLFVGADPETAWLGDCVTLDKSGFVVTGADPTAPALQASRPGVFAVGDARSGSVKRVGAAIGEGAQVVAAIHGYLASAV